MTFEQWKEQVDRELLAQVGLISDNLPDVDYRTAYENGVSAETMADEALRYAGKT